MAVSARWLPLNPRLPHDSLAITVLAVARQFAPNAPIAQALIVAMLEARPDLDGLVVAACQRLVVLGVFAAHGPTHIQVTPFGQAIAFDELLTADAHHYLEAIMVDRITTFAEQVLAGDDLEQVAQIAPHLAIIADAATARDQRHASHVCQRYALIAGRLGQPAIMLRYLKHAVELHHRHHGDDRVGVAILSTHLAAAYHLQNHLEQAQASYEHALRAYAQTYGPHHRDTLAVFTDYLAVLDQQGTPYVRDERWHDLVIALSL